MALEPLCSWQHSTAGIWGQDRPLFFLWACTPQLPLVQGRAQAAQWEETAHTNTAVPREGREGAGCHSLASVLLPEAVFLTASSAPSHLATNTQLELKPVG